MEGEKKRKYSPYHLKRPQGAGNKRKKLENATTSLSGLLFTCNGDEFRARREAQNLLQCYYDEQTDAEETKKDEEDAADALAQHSRALQTDQKWEWLDSGAKHVLFCKLEDTDVCHLVEWMVTKCQAGLHCRILTRVTPVHSSGSVSADVLEQLLKKHMPAVLDAKDGVWPTFKIEFIRRNNNNLSRDDVFDTLKIVKDSLSLPNAVNLTNPDVTLIVQIQKRTLLFGYAKDYVQRRKLSLRPPDLPEDNAAEKVEAQEEAAEKVEAQEEPGTKGEHKETEV